MSATNAPATAVKASFQGLAAAGPIAISGLQVGDVIVALIPNNFLNWFEPVVTVAGQLQQVWNADGSDLSLTAYFVRGV
ncbi:hypothetical protein [Burkholderia vietnamiensis]|uniref:hypothetical protein n=1 Tax=Burkholderia vietnamiensis TaxID=60552 RepID=UPI00075CD4E2|nr:hypothetical protein [Burkholderia vietnamiensis]KVF31772.1 hypothetical protein WJ08_13870 [Burkholderia vietnamiensis]KVF43648.1 hypothetical protein WJ10_10455 [Burkholderia vietnamiensis]HDR9236389.1 hypothetical protein [Burkholderia vietnamiensis]